MAGTTEKEDTSTHLSIVADGTKLEDSTSDVNPCEDASSLAMKQCTLPRKKVPMLQITENVKRKGSPSKAETSGKVMKKRSSSETNMTSVDATFFNIDCIRLIFEFIGYRVNV